MSLHRFSNRNRRPTAARPRLLLVLAATLVGVVAAGCASEAPEGALAEPADLVLRGGRIATVDKGFSIVEALAAKDARILALGSNVSVEGYIGEDTEVIELDGRLAIPGFIEGHGHFTGLGYALSVLDLTTARSWDDIVEQVRVAAENATPGEWIAGRGWHQEMWDALPDDAVEGNPVHEALSAVSPENPVLLTHRSGHAGFANESALEAAGIDRATADPPGGTIVRDLNGDATGLLRETAQRLPGRVMAASRESMTDEEREQEMRRYVELAGQRALAHGITSFQDAGSSFEEIELFYSMEEEGALPLRLWVMVREPEAEMADRLAAMRSVSEGDDYLAVHAIKKAMDGALGSHGAWLLEPYTDMPDTTGLVIEPEEEIRATAELALEHGYQLCTHAIGDRANRTVLDIYEAAYLKAGDGSDLRWRVEHAQHLDPSDIPRFAELGVVASMQGVHATSDGPWVPRRLGDQRAREGAYMWRALLDSGAVVTNGTDVPVEDIDPLASFAASVTRQARDGSVFYEAQRMTREEALRSYTIANAWAAFEEEWKGSLEPGKLADIAVLSADILDGNAEALESARVDLTVLGGKVVYRRDTP